MARSMALDVALFYIWSCLQLRPGILVLVYVLARQVQSHCVGCCFDSNLSIGRQPRLFMNESMKNACAQLMFTTERCLLRSGEICKDTIRYEIYLSQVTDCYWNFLKVTLWLGDFYSV